MMASKVNIGIIGVPHHFLALHAIIAYNAINDIMTGENRWHL